MKIWNIKHSKRGKKHISENVVGTLVIEKIAGKELTSKCFKSIWDWLPLLILFFFLKIVIPCLLQMLLFSCLFSYKESLFWPSWGSIYHRELKITKKVHFHSIKIYFFLRRLELTFFLKKYFKLWSASCKKLIRKNKLTRKNKSTRKHILYLKMCILVNSFFLVNIFFSY